MQKRYFKGKEDIRKPWRLNFRLIFIIVLFSLGIGLGAYAPDEWPKFHHDLHNTGYINAQGTITSPGLRWLYPSGNVIWSSPAIGDIDGDGEAEVVIGSNGHAVYAIDGYSGALEWRFMTGGDVWSSPAIRDVDGIQQIGWPGKSGIEPGSVAIIRFRTRLVEDLPFGTGIYNQGRINWVQAGAASYDTFFTDDPRTPAPGDMTTVTVGEPVTPEGFYASKTVADRNGGAVQSGDHLRYTVTIVNNSHQAATNVTFSDSLASNLSLVPGSVNIAVNPAGCTVSPGATVQVNCSGSFPADGVAVITYEVEISWTGSPPSSVCNQGLLTWSGGSMNTDDPINLTSSADQTCVTPGSAIPDGLVAFKLVTDDNGGILEPGDELTYTVVIFRHGEGGSSPYPMDLFQDRLPLNTVYFGGGVIYPLQDDSFYFRSWNTDVEVVVGSIDGKLYVLKGDSGARKWSYPTGMIEWSSAAIGDVDRDNELEIVIGTSGGDPNIGGDVYTINGTTGGLEWHYHVDSIVWSSPAIGDIDNDGTVEVVIGTNDGQVIALKGEDGSLQWSLTISSRKVASSPAIGDIDGNGSMEIVIGCHNGTVYVINGATGTVSLSFTTGGLVWSSPAIGPNGTVYVGSDDGNLYAIDSSSGIERWHYTTGGGVWSSPAIVDIDGDQWVEIIVGSNDGYIYAINHDGTRLWRFLTGDVVLSSPAIGDIDGDGKVEVVVGSRDGNVYAIDDQTVIPSEEDIDAQKIALDNSGNSSVSPNEIITYTITIINNGEGAMFNPDGPLLVDPIPANTTYVGCIAGCDGLSYNSSTSPPQVEWSGTINPGQTITIQFNVQAAGSLEGVTQICNSASDRQARITWSGGSKTLPPVCLGVAGEPDGIPDVSAYKTVEGWTGPLYNGDEFVYTITILNNTSITIAGANFTDTLPSGIDYAGICHASAGNCNGNDSSLSWSGSIPATGVVIQYHVRIDCSELGGGCPTGTLICNRGHVSWPGGSQPTTEACIRIGTGPTPGAAEDITAFKSVDWDGTLQPGSTLTYTIRIYNTSGSTVTANFVDQIPPNTENPVCLSPLDCSDNTVTWSGSIPGGGYVELQYQVTVSSGASGQICNYGQVSWVSGSLTITEPTNIICALVGSDSGGGGPGSLVAYKTATWNEDGVLNPGNTIYYTITLINTGGVNLTGITVHEPLPEHTSSPAFDAPMGWICNLASHVVFGEEIRCHGDLASSQVITLSLEVRLGGGATGQICNFSLVEWTYGGIHYTVPTNLLCIPLGTSYEEASGAIVAYKSADWEGSLRSGTVITYTITVRNLSDHPQEVHFTDDLPGWVTSASLVSGYSGFAIITGGPATGYQVTWNVGVAPHGAETLSFTVTVGSDPPDPLCNYGTAEWRETGDYMTVTNYLCLPLGSEASEGPGAIAAYKVVKWEDRDGNGFISRGDRLIYEFTIINTSEAPITVTITEELPDGVILSDGASGAWSCTDGQCRANVTVPSRSATQFALIAEVIIDAGVICNFAEVSWGSYIIPTNEICVPVGCCRGDYPPTPTVAAFKTAEWDGTLDTGATLIYHIAVLNYGLNDVTVDIIDNLPSNVDYGGGPDGTYSAEGITIPAGGSVELSFPVVVTETSAGEQICNFAEIHQADWTILTNLLCIPLGADYDDAIGALTAVKTARWSGALGPGTEITYTIRIENHSSSVIPARVSDEIPFGTYYSGGAIFTQNIDIGAGAAREVSFTVTASSNPPPQICNYAVIAWPRPGLTYRKPTNLYCINLGDIWGDPVEVWKTATDDNGGQLVAGDTITYNITITNNTTEAITDATFTDPIPEHTSYIAGSATASLGSIAYDSSHDQLVWRGTIPARGSVAVAFRVRIDEGVARGTVISNQGIVEWAGASPEEEPSDDPSTPVEDDPTVVTVFGGIIPPDDYVICAPNPVGDNGLVCWFDLPDDTSRAWFKLFDVDGKLLFIYELAPGTSRFPPSGRWNPHDNLGRPLGNGLYLYLVEVLHTNGRITRSKVHKLVVER